MVRGGQWFDKDRLRTARLALGVSQRELARRAGLSAPSVSLFERGLSHPEPPTLLALARALGVNIAELLVPPPDPSDLLRRRIEAGLLQRKVADMLGIPPATYSAVERGEMSLPPKLTAKLDKLLAERAAKINQGR